MRGEAQETRRESGWEGIKGRNVRNVVCKRRGMEAGEGETLLKVRDSRKGLTDKAGYISKV